MRVQKSKCAGRVHVDGFQNDKLENPPLKEGALSEIINYPRKLSKPPA